MFVLILDLIMCASDSGHSVPSRVFTLPQLSGIIKFSFVSSSSFCWFLATFLLCPVSSCYAHCSFFPPTPCIPCCCCSCVTGCQAWIVVMINSQQPWTLLLLSDSFWVLQLCCISYQWDASKSNTYVFLLKCKKTIITLRIKLAKGSDKVIYF